jgi:exonuclease III
MVNVNQKSANNVNKIFTHNKDCPKTTHESVSYKNRKTSLIVKNENYKKQVLKICHRNICGLQFKTDELVASLYPDLPDILCISEHYLNSIQIQLISPEEYNLGAEFCRQSFHKVGVCMYILKRFSFSVINILKYCKDKDLEACAVKFKSSSMNICIFTVYRSPSGNFQFLLNGLENILKKIYNPHIHIIICGDINVNYFDESKEKNELNDLLNSYNLDSIIQFPTRITNNSRTTIDNIFLDTTKFVNFIISALSNGLSDHNAQMLAI